MFQELVSRNADLRQLVERGYAVKICDGHLVVRDVPYLNEAGALQFGAIVTKIVFVDQLTIQQQDHQIFFCGSVPFEADGSAVANLAGGPASVPLSDPALVVQRSFSNKPGPEGFSDFFAKVESYVRLLSGPAMQKHGATPFSQRVDPEVTTGSFFKFHDTLSSRAEIGDLGSLLHEDVIAVIGLGGTGAYVLDFLVKSPVKAIRAFDGDSFCVHNAFRSPGRLADSGELGLSKADVYRGRYDNFRHGLRVEKAYITGDSHVELDGVTFAFVCVDKGEARARIFDLLLAKRIPFIDVGMGLDRKRGAIGGMVRVTHYSAEAGANQRALKHADETDLPDDEYRTNVQIGELNALNAAIAVVRYKQTRGFYADAGAPDHLLFGIEDLKGVGS